MLTREENEILTRVGPGTPAGELLRRYWHALAVAGELTEEKPIKAVKVLGEELAVFRDKGGRYGLVGEHCPHRSASLAFGRVEEEGIRCPYHGWKFDVRGRCLEQPAEPEGSTYKDRVQHKAYPVEKLGGCCLGIWDRNRHRCCHAGMCSYGRTADGGSSKNL